MGFLKRLFGGGEPEPEPADDQAADEGDLDAIGDLGIEPGRESATRSAPSSLDDEQARDRELLREEARRLDDELIQRQLRYADRSWTPPAQGGSRRSDDEDAKRESAR